MGKLVKTENPDKVGIFKFWAWQASGVSAAALFIMSSFLMIYCTNTLGMSAALVGTLMLVSRIIDGITDLFAGYIVDKTQTRIGKGRPYEFAILGAWLCTWLMYSVPGDASLTIKCVWVLSMYIATNAIFMTMKNAANLAYTVRVFKTEGQRIKIATFGGIVVMFSAVAVGGAFPILMNRIATSPKGWSTLMGMIALPMALIGFLRFLVKETVKVETTEEKPKLSDILIVLKHNPYVYIVAGSLLVYNLVAGMGIMSYFFTYVVGNVELMGTASAISLVVLPLLFFFPLIMKKVPMGKLVMIGCVIYVLSGIVLFVAGGSMPVILAGFVLQGAAALPITYLSDLMLIDCASYNTYKGFRRMDGTISAFKNFTNKVGSGIGAALVGLLLDRFGFDASLPIQPDSVVLAIRALMGLIPAILFLFVAILLAFYKLDKLMPEINKAIADKNQKTEV
jgi:Na+/melibiose symporter-like transporter